MVEHTATKTEVALCDVISSMDAKIKEKDTRIADLERQLSEAQKPRIANQPWFCGYDFIDAMPSELMDDDRHPDVRAYDAMRERADRYASQRDSARERYNRAADILDAAILEIVRNGCDNAGIIEKYQDLMREIAAGKA